MGDNETNDRKGKISLSKNNSKGDLPDSHHDKERMKAEETILDLPDVKDIPGQENVVPPRMESFADTTISSDDEEGVGVLDDDQDEDSDLVMGNDADVTQEEMDVLQRSDENRPTVDNNMLQASALDNLDFEGYPLNEKGMGEDVSGDDLDIPGADTDDVMEDIGEEDEENNNYSIGGDKDDSSGEGTS